MSLKFATTADGDGGWMTVEHVLRTAEKATTVVKLFTAGATVKSKKVPAVKSTTGMLAPLRMLVDAYATDDGDLH